MSAILPSVTSRLDTGGAPLELGHRSTQGDEPQHARGFIGCITSLRVNGQVSYMMNKDIELFVKIFHYCSANENRLNIEFGG